MRVCCNFSLPSASTSLRISRISESVGFWPSERITNPSSFEEIWPSLSLSKYWNVACSSASNSNLLYSYYLRLRQLQIHSEARNVQHCDTATPLLCGKQQKQLTKSLVYGPTRYMITSATSPFVQNFILKISKARVSRKGNIFTMIFTLNGLNRCLSGS